MSGRDQPRKADEVTRRRNLHKPPIEDTVNQEWLRRHGLEFSWHWKIPNDRDARDAEWGAENNCHITRSGPDLLYVSFKHHKIVRMRNPEFRP